MPFRNIWPDSGKQICREKYIYYSRSEKPASVISLTSNMALFVNLCQVQCLPSFSQTGTPACFSFVESLAVLTAVPGEHISELLIYITVA